MERTLEIIENDLENAQEELKPIREAYDKATKKVSNFRDELERYKIDNEMYRPMSDLSQYIGCNISSIKLVERDEDGSLDTDDMWGDEYFKVDENGHLDYSSEMGGVMSFDKEIDKYVMWCHHFRTEHDYVGFLEIRVDKDED